MKYDLKIHGIWNTGWWLDKPGQERAILHTEDDMYGDLDEKLLDDVLREQLDVADLELTPEKIKREFGYDENGLDISEDCLNRIVEYYEFRAKLYEKIRDFVAGNGDTVLADMFAETGADEMSFRYGIPPKYNNFSCEDPNYDGGQVEAYVEIRVRL